MSAPAVLPLIVGDLGTPELLIILAVVVLLFGSTKLPELARGSGRALRIFKAETKGLTDDEDDAGDTGDTGDTGDSAKAVSEPKAEPTTATEPTAGADLEARRRDLAARQAELDAERARLHDQSSAG